MAFEYEDRTEMHRWLRGDRSVIFGLNDQELDSLLGDYYSAEDLMEFYCDSNALPDRRDVIAMAICNRLQGLLDPEEELETPPSGGREREAEVLTKFIEQRLDEFKSGDERTGFGSCFEFIVLPWIRDHAKRQQG